MYRIRYKKVLKSVVSIVVALAFVFFILHRKPVKHPIPLERIDSRIMILAPRQSTGSVENQIQFQSRVGVLSGEEIFRSQVMHCNNSFTNVGNKAARLLNVRVSLDKLVGNKRGGEQIQSVLNQREASEYFKLQDGFFELMSKDCKKPANVFAPKDHLYVWFSSLSFEIDSNAGDTEVVEHPTIAVLRYEYANIYHTMTDWYNAFLLMKYFGLDSNATHALWIDAHPVGALDDVWSVLFSKSQRITQLGSHTTFRQLYWNPLGYSSPLLQHSRSSIPLLEEFRSWFLGRFGISTKDELNCKSIKVTFLFRKDYVAHPRNPKGTVQRKIANEADVVSAVKNRFLTFRVQNISTEKLDMKTQLKVFSSSDILIGMHGAGLTHAMFLPKHAGLFEMYPAYFSAANRHFKSIAKWRNLHYLQWINTDHRREKTNFRTEIPLDVVIKNVKSLHCSMCPSDCD